MIGLIRTGDGPVSWPLRAGHLAFRRTGLPKKVPAPTFARMGPDDPAMICAPLWAVAARAAGLVHPVSHRGCRKIERIRGQQGLHADLCLRQGYRIGISFRFSQDNLVNITQAPGGIITRTCPERSRGRPVMYKCYPPVPPPFRTGTGNAARFPRPCGTAWQRPPYPAQRKPAPAGGGAGAGRGPLPPAGGGQRRGVAKAMAFAMAVDTGGTLGFTFRRAGLWHSGFFSAVAGPSCEPDTGFGRSRHEDFLRERPSAACHMQRRVPRGLRGRGPGRVLIETVPAGANRFGIPAVRRLTALSNATVRRRNDRSGRPTAVLHGELTP
jgi:hypothetical protein